MKPIMLMNSHPSSASPIRPPLRRLSRYALLAGLTAALGVSRASAGPISIGSGPDGGTVSQYAYRADYAAWLIADLGDPTTPAPLEISPRSGAGRWTQQLTFDAGSPNLRTGDTFFVQELLTVGGGDFALRDWYQEILTPGWRWSDGAIFDSETSELVGGLRVSLDPDLVGFAFDPIQAGTGLLVVKVLEYIGPDDVAAATVTLRASTVVPEPGAATLLASGLFVALATRRCRGGASFAKKS